MIKFISIPLLLIFVNLQANLQKEINKELLDLILNNSEALIGLYEQAGNPVSEDKLEILREAAKSLKEKNDALMYQDVN